MAYDSKDERSNNPKKVFKNLGVTPSAQDDRYDADALGNVKGSKGHNMPRSSQVSQTPKRVPATDGDGAA